MISSEPHRILVVDDEPDMVETCRKMLAAVGYQVEATVDPRESLQRYRENPFNLVLIDLKMPHMDGLELMKEIHRIDPAQLVIVITAFASVSNAMEAMRAGAFDFIRKPFQMDDLLLVVERALRVHAIQDENRQLHQQLHSTFRADRIVGSSPALRRVLTLLRKVCEVDVPVLIWGESGTGKELFARSIHENSPCRGAAFMAVDCAALPETLLESELFGYEKGAFTGADGARSGLLESASGGTLLLDEIGELPLKLQSKLLRTLQEGTVRRLGGKREIRTNVRVVSATNQNLREMIQNGQFREDLFYRVNVVEIELPPLRERTGDITRLANYFFQQFQAALPKKLEGLSAAVLLVLEAYDWPGNVRELRNVIERACTLTESTQILPQDLPEEILSEVGQNRDIEGGAFLAAKRAVVRDFEKRYLEQLLGQTAGNVTEAAKQAGLSRPAFHRLMAKYSIYSSDFRRSP